MARATKSLVYAAGIGLLASAAAHIATFFGVNPQRAVPGVMLLHVLIFVVWIPAVFMLGKMCTKDDPWRSWDILARHAPLWMKVLSIVLFLYTCFNFFHTGFVLNQGGVPSTNLGPKALVDHGEIIRLLTDEEYERHEAYFVRGFSGHWMFFYACAMTVLYSLTQGAANQSNDPAEQDVHSA
ncbi:MAG: hypothetical protein JW993_14110 [Sedimentisphaerales bacterium]|nr:hypothetical protein [Sedimentisphaerales bacterium]